MSEPDAIVAGAFARLEALQALGARYCGAPGHLAAQSLLRTWLAAADETREHRFTELFFGKDVDCVNFWARLRGNQPGRLLLLTHYDTRPWADRDADDPRAPVPGANDGGSGTVLMAELVATLAERRQRPTVDLLFCDAEDWHEIDGKEVALGAARFVTAMADDQRPDACLEVDMVAGRELVLDVDVSCQEHDPSYELTLSLFQLGRALALPAFSMAKRHPYKWISCDHLPFMDAGIPTALFMDLDYPEWHTRADTIEACSPASLVQIAKVLLAWIYR
ncbi:MAG: M28 family peptidase [Myxococcota bacterium]